MFRYIVICGCLMAIAQAGIINGGLIAGAPLQQTLTIQPAAPALAVPAIATGPRLTTLTTGPALVSGYGVSSGLGLQGVAVNGYGLGGRIGLY